MGSPEAEDRPPRFLRQFALTGGRAKPIGKELSLDTLVQVTDLGRERVGKLNREARRIVDLSDNAISIAEVGAHLDVHLGIARVLVSDMHAKELVAISAADFDQDGPDLETLEGLLDDLNAL